MGKKKSFQNQDGFKTPNYEWMDSDITIPHDSPAESGKPHPQTVTLGQILGLIRQKGALKRLLSLNAPMHTDMAGGTWLRSVE